MFDCKTQEDNIMIRIANTRSILVMMSYAILAIAFYTQQTKSQENPRIVEPAKDKLADFKTELGKLKKELTDLHESPFFADVAVYAKAVDWMIRHNEYYGSQASNQIQTVLTVGLQRVEELKKHPQHPAWLDTRDKPVILGYVSQIDQSIQPFSVTIPKSYDPKATDNQLDIVLAGRDNTKTEVKFIASREQAKPKADASPLTDRIVVEPYGRGNNAYRWAGETDVFEAVERVKQLFPFDANRVILRGFSMGGAGTWHIGLHRPSWFAAISPGAGFSNTKGYANLAEPLPEYVNRCLHIYDAVDYAENSSLIPVIAYSGEKDKQIAAARNIENKLAETQSKPIKHFVAPGLEHKQPAEWLKKIDEEILHYLPQKNPTEYRFVTYTPKYGSTAHFEIKALEKHYEKAKVEFKLNDGNPILEVENVHVIAVKPISQAYVSINQNRFTWPKELAKDEEVYFIHENTNWKSISQTEFETLTKEKQFKRTDLQGPIDDAFMHGFEVVSPAGIAMHKDVSVYTGFAHRRFEQEWDRWMRGELPKLNNADHKESETKHLVLFGDPVSNLKIAEVLPDLPITWNKDELVVNGKSYDPKIHVPVMIYPRKKSPKHYVVLNSGHTFHEADFKGTNALLFPKLGDWAVLKLAPKKNEPNAIEVVDAGIFDKNWQFSK
jgi:hypothetical protein